ncbi:MAG: exodeoxyribonuclease VII small subunit [Flavobacteriales bacterium]|jgi:exodeoxyribonuclease VII small subunit
MKEPENYNTAYEELKKITEEIERESVSVDVLSDKVKRASYLIEYCQNKLRVTEQEVFNIIKQMESRNLPE